MRHYVRWSWNPGTRSAEPRWALGKHSGTRNVTRNWSSQRASLCHQENEGCAQTGVSAPCKLQTSLLDGATEVSVGHTGFTLIRSKQIFSIKSQPDRGTAGSAKYSSGPKEGQFSHKQILCPSRSVTECNSESSQRFYGACGNAANSTFLLRASYWLKVNARNE